MTGRCQYQCLAHTQYGASETDTDRPQRCAGPARLQAVLLPAHGHDACGPHREAPEVCVHEQTRRYIDTELDL